MMKQELEKYPVLMEFEVLWGQMDAARHVNNTIYLRWCESVRIAYFEAMGMDVSFTGMDVGPILGWQDCKYIFPLTYPDTAICGARTTEIGDDRFMMECVVYSKNHKRIASVSKKSIIPYSYKGLKKVAMPAQWEIEIKKLQSNKID